MSEASGSSSSPSQGRQGSSATKRTLSEPASVRQLGPSPVKRQYQASNIQSADDTQLKELERLERKEASLVNQLLHQLQMLHRRCNEERHQIVEEQRRLAERLELIDSNEKSEEQSVREKNSRKLEEIRLELSQLRQKMSLEGSPSNSSGMTSSSSVLLSLPSTSERCDISNASDIRRRLGSLDRQRQALVEQLYAATGSLSHGGSHTVDVQLHICAPGRDVAGSSSLTERVLPTSQQSELAASSPESSEQAQSSGEEDSEITSSSDVLIPQNTGFVAEQSSALRSRASVINHTAEPTVDLELEPEAEPNASDNEEVETSAVDCKKNEICEMLAEEREKKKEDSDLDLALTKLKNIGSLVEEELQCSICNELLVTAVTINCAHSFCKYCLGEWKKQRAECPMCRMPITAEHRSVILDSLISTIVGQLSMELQQRHKEVVEERASLEAAALVAAETSGAQMNRQGSSSQDNSSTPQSRGPRHQNYNHNNNHWQPLPPPYHHHHHHHHHSFNHTPNAHVPHFPHAHVAHAHPPHAHVHAPLAPTYHPLPPLAHPPHAHHASHASHAPPNPRHNTPPPRTPPRTPPGPAPGPAGLPALQAPGQQGQQEPLLLEHHVRLRRRHGRNMISSGSSSGSSTEEPSDTTSSYSSSGGFSSTSERTWFESDYGEYEDEENEAESPIVPGIPGRYYGGYGVCFYCNQRGHWSNGCPVRFGF